MRHRIPAIFASLLAALLLAAPPSRAQNQDQAGPPDESQAEPQPQAQATGVGRISLIQGSVSTQRGDTGDWNAAIVNTPIVPGDRVSTGDRSRAEVQLDYGNILRLDGNSVIRVTQVDQQHIQIEVAQGLVSYISLPSSGADVEIDAPNLAIHPQRDGVYRIQVDSGGQTLVSVRRGQAEVGTSEGSTTIHAGELITVRGDATDAQYRTSAAPPRDAFDQWNSDRDRLLQSAQNSEPLNPYYTGGADLQSNGTWQNVPGYGDVWSPTNVSPDWAPYRDGSWVWEPYWGWTWVSYEPWGWAPYHYGRWLQWNGSWAWWPGPGYPYYRPLWAPAYVSFFGFERGVGFGFGSFGWLPLGPADPCYPWWGGFGLSFNFFRFGDHDGFRGGFRGRGFISPLGGPLHGRAEFSNLRGLDSNARLRAGITSVSASRFGNGRVVPERRNFTAADIRDAQFARGGLPVVPGRGSLSATDRAARPGTVPSRNLDAQHFMMHNHPAPAQRSFAGESARIREQVGRQRSGNSEGRPQGRESPGGAARTGQTPRSSSFRQDSGLGGRTQANPARQTNGFRSFEGNRATNGSASNEFASKGGERSSNPSRPAGTPEPRANAFDNRGGWQRFSQPQGRSGFAGGRGSTSNPQSFRESPRYNSRPPLDLRNPIVQERSPSYGSRAPSSSAPRSYYSAPRQQPSYRAPEAPRGYSSAPRFSEPSAPRGNFGGGGAYRGGGGNRGGGSHSSGGHHSGRG